MQIIAKVKDSYGKLRNAILIVGGLMLLLLGVAKVPHMGGTSTGVQNSHSLSDIDIGGIANAEASSCTSGGDSGDSGSGSGGSSGDSSSGG